MFHFKLTKKNVKRLVTTMLLIAPIVYLFGTLFTYLNGAHGDIVLAQPVYTDEYIEVSSYVDDGSSYRLNVTTSPKSQYTLLPNSLDYFAFTYNVNGTEYRNFRWGTYSTFKLVRFGDSDAWRYYPDTDTEVFNLSLPWLIDFVSAPAIVVDFFMGLGTLSKAISVPTDYVPENNSANTEFLFGQFFSRDNFVSDIGKDVLSDDPHGFVPFAAMIKFVDENMLNIGSLQVGLMAYGYFYWCAHVLLLMLLFDLTTFFVTWVSHIGDKFGGNADE